MIVLSIFVAVATLIATAILVLHSNQIDKLEQAEDELRQAQTHLENLLKDKKKRREP